MKRSVGLSICMWFCVACDQGTAPPDTHDTLDGTEVWFPEVVGDTDVVAAQDYTGLVINEIESAGSPDDWFELYNGSGRDIDLGGVGFSDDRTTIKATFPWGTRIAKGQHLVVIASDTLVGFKLGRDEELVLVAPDGTFIDEVVWAMEGSAANVTWGRWPDGRGQFQLVVASPGGPNSRVEPEPEPTPECGDGRAEDDEVCDGADLRSKTCADFGFDRGELRCVSCDFDTAACEDDVVVVVVDVVLNEVTSAGDDQIELVNRGATPADLSGWSVTDEGWTGEPTTADHRWVFPAGSVLAAGGRRVLVKGVEHTFGLGGADRVVLWNAQGLKVDETSWGDGAALVSWCRIPDTVGPFVSCAQTLGAPNRAVDPEPVATRVIIDELYVDEPGADGPTVFTELWGPPGTSLNGWTLEGINGADNKVYRTVSLANAVIPADGRLVIATSQATGATLAARDLVGDVDWQNGPDAVRLLQNGQVVDAVQYGQKNGFRAGEGSPTPEPTPGKSLTRKAHQDTDNNAADFESVDPTPGT